MKNPFYNKNLGKKGENQALIYLKKNGFEIIEKNFFTKFGEIDVIALKNNTIYFIEVKTRSSITKGYPHEAVNKNKIEHMKKAAYFYILNSKYKEYKMKIGVVSIVINKNNYSLRFFDDLLY